MDKVADDIFIFFQCIFLNENHRTPIQMSLKLVPDNLINNNYTLVEIMACCGISEKPLSVPMLTRSIDRYIKH